MKKESGKWKTTLKMAVGSVGFLAGLCVVLILAGRFLCRKSNADIYDTTAVRTKDEEVKNEVVNIKCNHDKEQVVVPLENILAHIENHLSGGHEHE